MGFNYGLEKKNFDSQWAVTRKQYEDAGMSSEAIQAMYDYDWSIFNATRAYQNHTQEIAAPSFEQSEESYSPLIRRKYQNFYPYSHPSRTAYRGRALYRWNGCFRIQACKKGSREQEKSGSL